MQEENNFPKINPIKLKEEQNNDQNKNIKKEKEKNNKCFNDKNNFFNLLSCFGYFFFLFLILLIFSLNYYYTKNAFDDNKNVILPAEKFCTKVIQVMAKCLRENAFSKCQSENKYMEYCYEEVHLFNQRCYVFISELELCYRKNKFKKQSNKCNDLEKDLIRCGSYYKHFNIKEINIKDLFTIK